MAEQVKKTKVTCFSCGAVYPLDLSRVPPERKAFKCLKCGKQVPILGRILPEKKGAAPAAPAPAPEAKPAQPERPASAWEALEMSAVASSTGHASDDQGESWLAIYGDMMSILLLFFVLMFAISTIDKHKFQVVMEAVSGSLGGKISYQAPEDAGGGPAQPSPLEVLTQRTDQETRALNRLEGTFNRLIASQGRQDQFVVKNEPKGLVVIGQDRSMFDSGSADIKEGVRSFLIEVGGVLKGVSNDVVVEGHTDHVPISTERFASNWELSVARAANVVRFLLDNAHLDPERVSAAGYASFRPRHPPDSDQSAKNRRIEIVIQRRFDRSVLDGLPKAAPSGGAAAAGSIQQR